LRFKCIKLNSSWGYTPDPIGGGSSAPQSPKPLPEFKSLLLRDGKAGTEKERRKKRNKRE